MVEIPAFLLYCPQRYTKGDTLKLLFNAAVVFGSFNR